MKNGKFFLVIGIVALLLLFSMYQTATTGEAGLVQNIVGVVVTPLQKGLTSVALFVSDNLVYFSDMNKLSEENEALKEEIRELEAGLIELDKYRNENESLKEFAGVIEQNREFEYVFSQVIARDPENLFYTFTIDKGSADDIERYDAVITPDGLAGIVTEVGLTYSKVTSIIDEISPVGAIVSRTRDVAVLEEDATLREQGYCRLSYLPGESSAEAGDIVLTSGLGSIYPSGIVIGEVLEVLPEEHNISSYAIVEPSVDFENINYVMVIKSFNEQEGDAAGTQSGSDGEAVNSDTGAEDAT